MRTTHPWGVGWRVFFGALAAGITYVGLVLLGLPIPAVAIYGISAAVGCLGAWLGPDFIELLGNLTTGL